MTKPENPTALERYKALIHEAELYERNAAPDATGGSSYWNEQQDRLRRAFSLCPAGANKADFPSMSDTAWNAVYYHAPEAFDVLWKVAAAACRRDAAQLKGELEKQAREALAFVSGMESDSGPSSIFASPEVESCGTVGTGDAT